MMSNEFGLGIDVDTDDSNEQLDNVEEVEIEEQDEDIEVEEEDVDEEVDELPEEEDVKPVKRVKQPYTQAEIKALLKEGDFTKIDTSRLSEEGKLVMKSMQAGLTPKLQESSELKRELQEIKNALKEVTPKPQPKDIYEAFDQDPEGTMTFVNRKIQEMIESGAEIHAIEKVREVREQLRDRRMTKATEQAKQNVGLQESVNALLRAVPDVEKKQIELRDFAIEYMGMTPEELAEETNLHINGMNAVKVITRINTAYEKMMAAKRAKSKAKTRSVRVEKPGTGFEPQKTTKKDLIERAKKTGDWRSYLETLEE